MKSKDWSTNQSDAVMCLQGSQFSTQRQGYCLHLVVLEPMFRGLGLFVPPQGAKESALALFEAG